eukprot:TRINITY_DN15588_c0_g1_i1.p1 TRINITY_DN15588_c0_g1~~TRINITY_DN15588_c0_g1_i1.p1  ORF type:complete len:383 (+),score=61.42 TRINITY_DN15588_c0_g1_i1:126-1274(+)
MPPPNPLRRSTPPSMRHRRAAKAGGVRGGGAVVPTPHKDLAALKKPGAAHPAHLSDRALARKLNQEWYRGDGRPAAALSELNHWMLRHAKEGYTLGPMVFCAALFQLEKRRKAKQAEALHDSMPQYGVQRTDDTYSSLLFALVRGDRCDRIAMAWHRMVHEDGVVPNQRCHEALLLGYSKLGDFDAAAEVYQGMRAGGFITRDPRLVLALVACAPSLDVAENIVTEHRDLLDPCDETCLALLEMCRRVCDAKGARKVYLGYLPKTSPFQLTCLYSAAMRACGMPSEAMSALKALPTQTRRSFEELLHCLLDQQVVPSVFMHYLESAVEFEPEFAPYYVLAIRLYVQAGDSGSALAYAHLWRERGVRPNAELIRLSDALGARR